MPIERSLEIGARVAALTVQSPDLAPQSREAVAQAVASLIAT